MIINRGKFLLPALVLALGATTAAFAQSSRYDELAAMPYERGYLSDADSKTLLDELTFQRAVQTYLWALPALNMYGMKEGSEAKFGKGYNVLPIFKKRLNAKTLITTPNSDVIYALGYLDLKEDGPMVIEVPPGLQGIIDDFWQRPIPSEGEIDGKRWAGDVGLPGPDAGKGGKYLVLPPDYTGDVPEGYFPYRSGTYGVFVFWRGFFKDPNALEEPVKVMEQTKIYPLGKQDSAKPMEFPDASDVPVNMLFPQDGTAFDMFARFIDHEYVDPRDFEMRGIAASLGIVKGKPFTPDEATKKLLDAAAKTAARMGHILPAMNPKYYEDRQWLNPFPGGSAEFRSDTYNEVDRRTGFFTSAYSTSPGMAVNMENVGAKYPNSFKDADGDFLSGDRNYKLTLPPNIPAAIFWSLTLYDPVTASGLDNGQPFPSLNTMDKPVTNADGSVDIYVGPTSPGEGKNWLATVPGKGFFTALRLYGPKKAFFDQTWKPGDLEKVN
ncbi:Uncharacterized conserved protein [Mesorhizobium albiziae]|uniref:Uncharacterized conserved protein n=1 Tax=Neomesorhizobium albiziae TaxID=335020 RepID=A0A1I3V3Q8_9HYPH|nr:DUF1254 domain-containing protein [Mesorhizobium albiziae]GLS28631.1 hypothetical protein GCM10007937_03380 [Mesorhizobium albiziae]SFJ89752.1 Uncharacterized conserved protein [Mesorhizobium albiziae]